MLKTRPRLVLLLVALSVLWAALSLAGPFLLATRSSLGAVDGGKSSLQEYVTILHLDKAPTTLAAPWFAGALAVVALGTLVVVLLSGMLDRNGHSTRALR